MRNSQEVSRSAFYGLLMEDIADPETNEVDQVDYAAARRNLNKGEEIHAGRTPETMSTYQIV
jgi:hypothetical protein